ncbi:universal stress protein [Roseospira visakhapatnamensis]|uniref:Nucleotide-binding universal stress UspA family protein n=1 Tax=Roseospira visakhapatnamensis TaxID=390880 RepID=A0A7W6RB93_9PROT|nr:universal stress protein [Roseospira visakhapatnamensis]MBB4264961.1 nucleotide-binding universal stress UspA family protein [Roseospira visakhapatnamensis]
MSDETPSRPAGGRAPAPMSPPLTFLVVVDDTEEMHQALRFASVRARATGGRVAMLRVVEPPDFQHFGFVGEQMQREAREEAERLLQRLAAGVNKRSRQTPMLEVREGLLVDQILEVVADEPEISALVVAARKGKKGPGPLIAGLAGSFGARLRVPAIVIPAGLTDEEIDRFG